MINRIILLGLLCILVLLPYPALSYAESSDSTVSTANMGLTENVEIANVLDRLKERIALFFKFSKNEKVDYHFALAEKRFLELDYVVKSGYGDLVEETSSRYAAYMGRLANFIVDNKMANRKDQFLNITQKHGPVLEQLRDQYESNSGLWLLIQHDINTDKILSEKLKNL